MDKLTRPRSLTPGAAAPKGGKGKGKEKGKKGRDSSRDPSKGRKGGKDGKGKDGKGKDGKGKDDRSPARGKDKLYCKSFLATGKCERREKGLRCGAYHLNAEQVGGLKIAFGDELQGYYNPKKE